MGIKILGIAPAQYTARWKKTLMMMWECTLCGTNKAFRKARLDSWKTKSCGCWIRRKILPWYTYWSLIVLTEAPRTRDGKNGRQLYVECSCWNRTILKIREWGVKKTCWHKNWVG